MMILNDNSVTTQDIKIKFFKFKLTPMEITFDLRIHLLGFALIALSRPGV